MRADGYHPRWSEWEGDWVGPLPEEPEEPQPEPSRERFPIRAGAVDGVDAWVDARG
eukprot:COSAG01_NODE_13270_length_1609_cov_1.515894_2_plen_56_part_00